MPLSYAIVGQGRMGRAIARVADERGHRRLAAADSAAGLESVLAARPDVVFEFTRPEAARGNVLRLAAAGLGVVCGTTGWGLDEAVRTTVTAGGGALVVEPNFSIGVQIYLKLVEEAAGLSARFDTHEPAIAEWHHRGKRDSPSGTARRMATIVQAADPRVLGIADAPANDPAEPGMMPVTGVRVGHEPGRHQLILDGPDDRITIEHAARDRRGFALGAVRVAEWIEGRSGIFTLAALIEEQLQSGDGAAGGGRS